MFGETGTHIFAGVVLAALLFGLFAWAILAWRRSSFTPLQYPFFLFHIFMSRMVWRTRVTGKLPISRQQGAVLVGNHRSSIDPSFIQVAADRVVHWMIASEYWKVPFLGWFFRLAECIPANRGGIDTAAIKMAMRYTQNGGIVGMFPEGTINTTDKVLLPGRPGAALVALKSRVPVVPVFVHNAPYDGTMLGCFIMPAKVRVVIGAAIDLSEYYGREREDGVLQELTLRFMKEIARLGGHPDFEPQIAGRRWKPES
ncbi:MAG TPA: lysophospholipid acyltransferase family protein [Pirellulales bacterium]|nr:lysophospholipid acyltransferase family protein [Pirellulales bacterium]